MKRFPLVVGILGLLVAVAGPARAAEVTLFGKKYDVVSESRAQTYKNGLKVVLPGTGNQKANLYFAEGADPSRDRLFVACPINGAEDNTGHQLYLLTGADAGGRFTKDATSLTEFFGGNQNLNRGGRPDMVMLINDVDTGAKADRNLVIHTLAGDDHFRFYDLDTLSGSFDSDALFSRIDRQTNADEGDPRAPRGAFGNFAPGPGGAIVCFGRSDSAGIEIGVTDPKKDEWFDVLTKLHEVTANATTPITEDLHATAAIRYAENEYWVLVATGAPDGDNDSTESSKVYRLLLTFPADLTKGTPGSIKVEVLGVSEELKGTALGGASDGAMFGMAVGREVATGLRRLYFADWAGNLSVATPVP